MLVVDLFGVARDKKDGLQSFCKKCKAQHGRENRSKYIRVQRIRQPEWRAKNRHKVLEYVYSYQDRCPEKVACRIETRKAISGGVLVKTPCKVCGVLKVDAHHPDYSKPLEVVWLCRKHHSELHTKEKHEQRD